MIWIFRLPKSFSLLHISISKKILLIIHFLHKEKKMYQFFFCWSSLLEVESFFPLLHWYEASKNWEKNFEEKEWTTTTTTRFVPGSRKMSRIIFILLLRIKIPIREWNKKKKMLEMNSLELNWIDISFFSFPNQQWWWWLFYFYFSLLWLFVCLFVCLSGFEKKTFFDHHCWILLESITIIIIENLFEKNLFGKILSIQNILRCVCVNWGMNWGKNSSWNFSLLSPYFINFAFRSHNSHTHTTNMERDRKHKRKKLNSI